MISDENKKKLLQLLADVIHDRKPEPITDEEWNEIYPELKVQTVHALPGNWITELGLNFESEKRAVKDVGRCIQIFYNNLEEQSTLIQILKEHEIPAVVLKGAAAAVNYPNPEYRCMGDIDLIVRSKDFERACNILEEKGYTLTQEFVPGDRHANFLTQNEIKIELHHHFSSSKDQKANRILDGILEQALSNAKKIDLEGYEISSFPPLENGLVLLAHINQHLGGGLGLRQVIDWLMFVEKYLDDTFWKEQFEKEAEGIGLRRLAVVVTAMCKKYLGLQGKLTWCDSIFQEDPSVVDELIEYIFAQGNFGVHDTTGATTVSVIRMFRNPIKGLIKTQKTGIRTHPVFQKYPVLSVFAWFFQLIRWTRRGFKRGVRIGSLRSMKERENKETDLLQRLGVTRM